MNTFPPKKEIKTSPCDEKLTEFEHGGDIDAFAKKIGSKVEDIIDLSSNINFLSPKISTDFSSLDIASYPKYDDLYTALAKHYNVKSNQMELFNGGSAAIFALFRSLKCTHCTIYAPAYLEYKRAAKLFGYNTTFINRFRDQLSSSDEVKEVPVNSLVIYVNPTTPDGDGRDLSLLLDQWIAKNSTILIDESFLEFTNLPSVTKKLKRVKNLYILKSMTKIYGAAGIRIGALISSVENITKIKSTEPLWKMSQFDSSYLMDALSDKNFITTSKQVNDENRALMISVLEKSKYVKKIFPTVANYLLIKLEGINAQELQEKLANHKIMIRDCSNFDFLDSSYVRIAIKSKDSILKIKNLITNNEI